MSTRIIELVKDCKLVKEKAIENGHDCWGKLEWTTELYVDIGDKRERVHEGMFIVHDGKTVEAAIFDWQLKEYQQSEVERSEEVKKEPTVDNFRNFIRTYHLTSKWEDFLNGVIS